MRTFRQTLVPTLLLLAVPSLAGAEAPSALARQQISARALQQLASRGDALGVDKAQALEVRDVLVDPDGTEHVRMNRSLQGLRIHGGDLVVHSEATGKLRGFSGKPALLERLELTPTLDAREAIARAEKEFRGAARGAVDVSLLIDASRDEAALAYEVTIPGETFAGPTEMHYLIDARSGELRDRWDGIQTTAVAGLGNSFFAGNVPLITDFVTPTYYLRDPSRGNTNTIDLHGGTSSGTVVTDTDNIWGTGLLTSTQTIAVDAQFGAVVTWDYFKGVHLRNGIFGTGVGAQARIHYSTNYANAFWGGACNCMTIGDGDGSTFYPLAALDVIGHEMTHGVISSTANLTYSGESGALNESTADIFGTMIEYFANNATDLGDFKIGEKILRVNPGEVNALRYMWQPSLDGSSVDCYSAAVPTMDPHYSSGVGNHFFYLLAQGSAGSGGTPASPTCNGLAVTGIGKAAAAKIWYRALTIYMTSSTTYSVARAASIQAAKDLYGVGSVQALTTAAAWSAVNVP